MLRSHIASFVIGSILVGGSAGAATVSGITARGEGEAAVTAEVENHLQTAEDAFAKASALAAMGEEGVTKAEGLYADGTGDLLEAVEDANGQASSGAEASVGTMDLVARASADLATRFTTSTGAHVDRLAGVKGQLIGAIDKQVAAAHQLAEEQRTELLAVLEGARADLAGRSTTTVATPTGTVSTGGTTTGSTGQVTVSGRASQQTNVSGGSVATPAPAPAPAPARTTVTGTETPSATTSADAQADASVNVGGLLPRP